MIFPYNEIPSTILSYREHCLLVTWEKVNMNVISSECREHENVEKGRSLEISNFVGTSTLHVIHKQLASLNRKKWRSQPSNQNIIRIDEFFANDICHRVWIFYTLSNTCTQYMFYLVNVISHYYIDNLLTFVHYSMGKNRFFPQIYESTAMNLKERRIIILMIHNLCMVWLFYSSTWHSSMLKLAFTFDAFQR